MVRPSIAPHEQHSVRARPTPHDLQGNRDSSNNGGRQLLLDATEVSALPREDCFARTVVSAPGHGRAGSVASPPGPYRRSSSGERSECRSGRTRASARTQNRRRSALGIWVQRVHARQQRSTSRAPARGSSIPPPPRRELVQRYRVYTSLTLQLCTGTRGTCLMYSMHLDSVLLPSWVGRIPRPYCDTPARGPY